MADQFPHPLMGILADFFATKKGQEIGQDVVTAMDAAQTANDYASAAPERIYERATNDKMDAGEAIGGVADLALLLFGGANLAKGGMAAGRGAYNALTNAEGWKALKGLTKYAEPIGPKIAKDAATYTGRHSDAAKSVLRKQLSNPTQTMNHNTVRHEYLREIARKGLNAGPQGQQLDDMITGTLRRIDPKTNLQNPASVEAAIQAATGIRRNGVPKTLAVTGMAGAAGAGAMDEPQDPQTAQVAEIIRRIRAGEI